MVALGTKLYCNREVLGRYYIGMLDGDVSGIFPIKIRLSYLKHILFDLVLGKYMNVLLLGSIPCFRNREAYNVLKVQFGVIKNLICIYLTTFDLTIDRDGQPNKTPHLQIIIMSYCKIKIKYISISRAL